MNNSTIHKCNPGNVAPAQQGIACAKVLVIRRREDPTDDIYISTPLKRLVSERDVVLETLTFGGRLNTAARLLPYLRSCTHVIVSRYCPGAWRKTLLNYPGRPFQIVYLVDDDIPAAPKTGTLPLSYRIRMGRVARREFSSFMRGADRVVVTSVYLAEKYRADNVNLLPPASLWRKHPLDHFKNPENMVITFHATAIHQGDLVAIAPALRRVHAMRSNVRLEIVTDGTVPGCLRRLRRCRIRTDMPWSTYKEFVRRSESHIGLAPLMDSPFNRGKSHIKLFDITAMGAAGIYSNRAPYADVVTNGVHGLLVDDSVDSWIQSLIELIDNPRQARQLVESAQERVAEIGDPAHIERYWRKVLGLDD